MRFPPAFIVRLRTHFLLHELIGRRMPLKKHGRDYLGLCPFHGEKTPSFHAYDDHYHCFGCGAHGDAIEFIRKFERLSYPEAIETLAREAGIPLPEMTREEVKKAEAAKTLHDVLEAAAQWFERQLSNASGAHARDYAQRRGLKAETLRLFRIGYAPDERDGLYKHLKEAGFAQNLQAEAGLIVLPEQGAPYDRFRARLMFPIRNASGRVIAFGGRLMANAKNAPKYLNSPETPVFKKSELLYNLDLAKHPARQKQSVVVMEGYMDVVSTAQSGIDYAVATLGTAVSAEHLRLLWQLAKEPVMCLDGDSAGVKAMLRAAEVALPLLKPGYSLRFATLPSGEDPDSYIQKYGKAAFEKLTASARRLSQVLWENAAANHKLDVPEERASADDALNQLAAKISNATVRQHYASFFKKQLWASAPNGKTVTAGRSGQVERVMHNAAVAPSEMLAHQLLRLAFDYPQLLHSSGRDETLARLDIADARLAALRDHLLEIPPNVEAAGKDGISAYLEKLLGSEALQALQHNPVGLPYPASMQEQDAVLRWNDTLQAYQIAHLEQELKTMEATLGQALDDEAYQRYADLQKELRSVREKRTFALYETEIR